LEPPTILVSASAAAKLLVRAQVALRTTQQELAQRLGASRRTATRWAARQSSPSPEQMRELARLAYAAGDTALAADIATTCGETMVGLGLVAASAPIEGVAPVAPPPRPSPLVVDAVVCAAADEAALTPSAVRGILRAAFARAVALGLTAEEVADALSPPTAARRAP
jgi:DNA-binding XRE family transcriptional regulator